ncbi:MAG: shikimate kinase [Clostridiales bacterium]
MKNVVLIGMPNTGKSSVGKELAKILNMKFVDTDYLIKKEVNMELRDIVIEKGLNEFLKIQESTLLKIKEHNAIISTGGSVIYSDSVMLHLKKDGIIVFLDTKKEILIKRITSDRRFAKEKSKNFDELYNERIPLYRKYADFRISCDNRKIEEISEGIVKKINNLIN